MYHGGYGGYGGYGHGGYGGYSGGCCAPSYGQSNCCSCSCTTQFATCACPEPVMQTASAHTFLSPQNCEYEELVCRNVDYITEYVTVPVTRPIVHETIDRVREVPVDHIVDVHNVPAPCGNAIYGAAYPRCC